MKTRTKIGIICLFGVMIVIAAYISRGAPGAGSEYFLIPVFAGIIITFIPEPESEESYGSKQRTEKDN